MSRFSYSASKLSADAKRMKNVEAAVDNAQKAVMSVASGLGSIGLGQLSGSIAEIERKLGKEKVRCASLADVLEKIIALIKKAEQALISFITGIANPSNGGDGAGSGTGNTGDNGTGTGDTNTGDNGDNTDPSMGQSYDEIYNGLTNEQKAYIDNLDNLPADYQGKMSSLKYTAAYLLQEGYEPEFVAGVLGNVVSEGTAGKFESSAYISNPEMEPDYLVYLDENYDYREKFSGKNIQEVGIKETEELMAAGKFGLGSCQWTSPERAQLLIECYKEVCGSNNYPTAEQCMQAEALCITKELDGDYNYVYENWKSGSAGMDPAAAAERAGQLVCTSYEVPDGYLDKQYPRGDQAELIYNTIMGM